MASVTVSLPVVTTTGDSPTGLAADGTISVPSTPTDNWLNGALPSIQIWGLFCVYDGGTSWRLTGAVGSSISAITLGTYSTKARFQSVLDDFVSAQGLPWIAIDDNIPSGSAATNLIALNAAAPGLPAPPGVNGGNYYFNINGTDYYFATSAGWAAILAAVGNYAFPVSLT